MADPTEQANCYQALYSTLWNNPAYQSWFKGTYLWNWDVTPNPDDPLGYTPQGKPAEGVMTSYYRLPGDANLDGKVDINDLTVVLAHYNQTGMTWSQGDFTGDGKVDINDLTIVLANYNTSDGSPPAGDGRRARASRPDAGGRRRCRPCRPCLAAADTQPWPEAQSAGTPVKVLTPLEFTL